MIILGIETSCDETAVALIEASGNFEDASFQYKVLGNALLSQADMHAPYGGVYPNVAKREHSRNLVPILTQALEKAGALESTNDEENHSNILPSSHKATNGHSKNIRMILEREPELFAQLQKFVQQYEKPEIDAIAITTGPGLEPALWVGVNFARALSLLWDVPIVPVNHMEGHIIISALTGENNGGKIKFPTLALLISGGHTELVLMEKWLAYQKIGQTRDDAVGEAFDKTARLLGLPYPGGPQISKLAAQAREENLEQPFSLPRPMIQSADDDFSFSGLKTAVRKLVEKVGKPSSEQIKQIAREFENAVADVMVAKVCVALRERDARTLILGGGVSANTYIKQKLQNMAEKEFPELTLLVSPPEYATDNALMIALAGYFHAQRNEYADPDALRANGNLSLSP